MEGGSRHRDGRYMMLSRKSGALARYEGRNQPEFAFGARGNGQAQTAATGRVRDSLWMVDERQHEERHAEHQGRKTAMTAVHATYLRAW